MKSKINEKSNRMRFKSYNCFFIAFGPFNKVLEASRELSQDSIGAVFNGVPSIRTNSIQTQVLVNNGETVVLGGVFQTVVSEGTTKTPVLGDLPWVGSLFRQKSKSDDKQELLIFITPRLIRDSLTQR